jgi:EmrB/QacA subfamily drug resistance transporter
MSATNKRKLALIGVLVASAIGGLVFSELTLAIASMQQHLHATLGQMQWTINIYGIMVCSTLVLFGRMGDIYGRKKIFLVSLLLLALSMAMTGSAYNIYVVIAAQGINGLASAIIMPVSQALVTNMFGEADRSKAIGLWAGATGIALGLGPVYSGFIIHWLTWRWVFLLNVPVTLVSFVFVLFNAKESRSDEANPVLDWQGALTLGIAMASFVMMIVESESWPHDIIVLLAVISIISFVVLYFIEAKAKQPIIREDLFKNRAFLLASFTDCILVFFIWSDFFLLPLFLQSVLKYTPFDAGLIMLLVTVPLVLFSMRSKWFYERFGPKKLIMLGAVFLILAAVLQLLFKFNTSLAQIIAAAICFGFAWALIWSPAATKAVSTLPLTHAGIASGTFVTIQEVGGSMGLAITGAVVRRFGDFDRGFAYGMVVLIIASLLGLIAAFLMQKAPRQTPTVTPTQEI